MVAVMEVSEADRATLATPLEGNTISAVVGVVKVLAKIVLADADRLSPPAPEVDEATVWTRKVLHAHQRAMTPPDSGWGNMSYEKGSYDHLDVFKAPRTALSELIASKDAEIEEWKAAFHEALWAANKAAECNTAEPERPCTCHPDDNPPRPCPKRYALDECRAATTDTTPEVVVTQADRAVEMLNEILLNCRDNYSKGPLTEENDCDMKMGAPIARQYLAEAEARGRREALEEVHAWALAFPNMYVSREYLIQKIERMMTGGK